MKKRQTKVDIGIHNIKTGDMGNLGIPTDPYAEPARPNLYNVVKKIREQKGPMIHRMCYISKIDESKFRGEFEKEMISFMNPIFTTQEPEEIPMGEEEELQFGGMAVVLGPWVVHMFEAEQTLMTRFLNKLLKKTQDPGSYYLNSWVLHYTEDVPVRAYNSWNCKQINTSQAIKEIKSLSDFEKIQTIYQGMVDVGQQAKLVQQKGQAVIAQTMKQYAAENIPCGEELASVINENVLSLEEWMDFAMVTPDICLEKEMQWPVEQDLIY